MAKKKHRPPPPSDPAEIARKAWEARRNPAMWGPNEDALKLRANDDVQDEAASRTKVRNIQRYDCFALLHSRGSLDDGQEGAIRRLQEDVALLHATSGQRRGTSGPADVDGFSAARCDAGARLAKVLDGDDGVGGVSAITRTLLLRLIEPELIDGQRVNWRATVQAVTGEYRKTEQGRQVVAACQDLASSYTAQDNNPRRKAA